MFYKGKKVGHSNLVIVHDTVPCHDVPYYHTKFGHPASNSMEDVWHLTTMQDDWQSKP